MIASGLAASSASASAVPSGGGGRASRGEDGGGDSFEQLMNPGAQRAARSQADARAAQSRGAEARGNDGRPAEPSRSRADEPGGSDRTRSKDAGRGGAAGPDDPAMNETPPQANGRAAHGDAVADAAAGADDRNDAHAADAALPDQLFAMIGGWRDGAPATATGALAPAAAGSGAGMPAALAALPGAGTDGLPGLLAGGAPGLAGSNSPAGASAADGESPALAGLVPGLAMPAMADAAEATAGPAGNLPVDFARVLEQAGDGTAPDLIPELETGERTLPPGASASPATGARPVAAAGQPPLAFPANPDAGFDDAFGARIGWLAEQRIGHAEIRLNPETLGTIDVRLQIDGTRVSAEFQSANADVRHALENSVGRLRDLLGQHGLQLAHSDVGQGRGDDAGDGRRDGAATGGGDGLHGDARTGPGPAQLRTRGLLDEYA